jgi:hypothetical protein
MVEVSLNPAEKLAIKRLCDLQLESFLKIAEDRNEEWLQELKDEEIDMLSLQEDILNLINRYDLIRKNPEHLFKDREILNSTGIIYILTSYFHEINSSKVSTSLLKKLAYAQEIHRDTQNLN